MRSVGRFLRAHFAAYRRRAKWSFLWRISIEGLLVPLVLGLAIVWALQLPERADLNHMATWDLMVSAVVLAPFFETLLFQALPIAVARVCGWGFWAQVAVSNVLFALPHFGIAASTGIAAGVLSGFYIAFTYAHWRETSFRSALWMTAGMHSLHNLILLGPWLVERRLH